MSDPRMVAMTAEQAAELDRYIEILMRGHFNERATTMMTLRMAYQFAQSSEPVVPSNVVELYPQVTHAGDNWSRKVPCS